MSTNLRSADLNKWLLAQLAASACLAVFIAAAHGADATAEKSSAKNDNLGQRKEGAVGQNEELSFRQSKVSAEMTELEERMFRLSEALKQLEPENSSRLMSGVKYARDELILHEMQEIQAILNKSDYKLASGQEKELIAKLRRLEELLLSSDQDLQLQLQKLRLLRDILHKLDAAIEEEGREQKLSSDNTDKDKKLKNNPSLREKLEELIKQQTGHVDVATKLTGSRAEAVADSGPASKNVDGNPAASSPAKLYKGQTQTRDDTKALEERLTDLADARGQMDEALAPLEKGSFGEALPHQNDALDSLKKLAAKMDEEQKQLEKELSQERFNAMRKDQEQNHGATDKIGEMVRDLGDTGAGAIGELTRAGGSMGNAESRLGDRQPEPAGQQQNDALGALKYARSQLSDEEQKLLNKIRAEVKKRVLEGLTEMLERQVAVRESTERFAPKMKEGSRQVLTSVVALSKSEDQIIQIGDGLLALVEETEFGIALPAALRSIVDEMDGVKQLLSAGEASAEVVTAEKQIEADLKELLECMKQLPSSGKSDPGKPGNGDDRERELNRLVAELKMIRMLQIRVSRDTKQTDEKRAAEQERLSAQMRQTIQAIHDRQADVHDVTDRLNTVRGNELRQ
jgi:hypothetical protein